MTRRSAGVSQPSVSHGRPSARGRQLIEYAGGATDIARDLDGGTASGTKFFLKEAGKRVATPLLAVVTAIEAADLVFAVDSVPAVLAVGDNAFIVYTSNAFAILGLRALYFLLAGLLDRFHYLRRASGSFPPSSASS